MHPELDEFVTRKLRTYPRDAVALAARSFLAVVLRIHPADEGSLGPTGQYGRTSKATSVQL